MLSAYLGVVPAQVQRLALDFVERPWVYMGPGGFEFVKVPLDGIPSFCRISCRAQLDA